MAHYAFIDENNVVADVIVGKSEGNFDWEQHYGMTRGMLCKRTSYNTYGGVHYDLDTNQPSADQSKALRKNFAGIGYTYDAQRDAFIPPQPFQSWTLNDQTCLWDAPVPYPDDDTKPYLWDEATVSWIEVTA